MPNHELFDFLRQSSASMPPGISLIRDTDDRQWSEWGPFFEG